MDNSLFSSLTAGCDFDLKRFKNDAIKLGLIKSQPTSIVQIKTEKEPEKEKLSLSEIPSLTKANSKIKKSSQKEQQSSNQKAKRGLKIYTSGNDIPNPIPADANFINFIKFPLPENFYKNPTPVQSQSIPILRESRNCLVCAPTGSGKTLSFLLPIVEKKLKEIDRSTKDVPVGANVLILQPSKELALQTFIELEKIIPKGQEKNIRPHCLSDISEKTRKKFSRPAGAEDQTPNILLTTPNKLIYLMKSKDPELAKIFKNYLASTKTLIIDEADKLFEESHKTKKERSFRSQLAEIFQTLSNFVCHFFSATYSSDVEKWCNTYLDSVISVTIGTRNTANNKIDQKLIFTNDENAKIYTLKQMFLGKFSPPVLIFVQSKERVKQLYNELKMNGRQFLEKFKISSIHGDLNDKVRLETIKKFRTGETWVLICTELMGRGMDFPNVGLVVNFDLPTSPISYIHRIGRTARGENKTGQAVTFFTTEDRDILRTIGGIMRQAGCEVPDYIMELKKLNNKERRKIAKSNPDREAINQRQRAKDRKDKLKDKNGNKKDLKLDSGKGRHQKDQSRKGDKRNIQEIKSSNSKSSIKSNKKRKITVDDLL